MVWTDIISSANYIALRLFAQQRYKCVVYNKLTTQLEHGPQFTYNACQKSLVRQNAVTNFTYMEDNRRLGLFAYLQYTNTQINNYK